MSSGGNPWSRIFVGNVAVDLVAYRCALRLIMYAVSASDPLAVVPAQLHHHHSARGLLRLKRTASG